MPECAALGNRDLGPPRAVQPRALKLRELERDQQERDKGAVGALVWLGQRIAMHAVRLLQSVHGVQRIDAAPVGLRGE